MTRAALKLFSSGEDALEFLEDYGLDEAHVKLLGELDRIPEAADIHAQNGDILKAVGMLTASAVHNVDHARPAIKFVLAGLRQDLTLRAPPTQNSIVSKLLGFANRLDKSVMTKQDIDEVRSSHPFGWWVLHPRASSSRCSKRSNALIIRVSIRLPRPSL